MTVTVASFRAAFPAFASETSYSGPEIEFWLAFALLRHNAERWGNLLDMGCMLFVAHNLSLESNARRAEAAGQGAGSVVGVLTSITADGVGWTRQAPATDPNEGHWGLTSYGKRWKEMAKMMGAGGLMVGTPSPDEARGGAWPGPFPAVW